MSEYPPIHTMNTAHTLQPDAAWRNRQRVYTAGRQAAIDLKTALYSVIITLHFNSSGDDRFRRA